MPETYDKHNSFENVNQFLVQIDIIFKTIETTYIFYIFIYLTLKNHHMIRIYVYIDICKNKNVKIEITSNLEVRTIAIWKRIYD